MSTSREACPRCGRQRRTVYVCRDCDDNEGADMLIELGRLRARLAAVEKSARDWEASSVAYGRLVTDWRARAERAEAERDEARRLHSEAEGQIACRSELRYRCARAETELERLRAVAEAARAVVRGRIYAESAPEWPHYRISAGLTVALEKALAALSTDANKRETPDPP